MAEFLELANKVAGFAVVVESTAKPDPHILIPSWSGHKMYAPFGAGVLIRPRSIFATGNPFLAGGGAVDLVDLDEVVWTDHEEAGLPNVLGAVALHAAIDELNTLG